MRGKEAGHLEICHVAAAARELADETGDALDRAGDATEDVINDITEDEASTEDVTNN